MALAAPTPPRFEHRTDESPVLGIGASSPRLSWTIPAADPGEEQTAYEVEVSRGGGQPERYRVDGSGAGAGDGREQVLVPWPARPLASRESAAVRVRVASGDAWSDWGEPAIVEAGLLNEHDWTASFVSPVGVGGLRMPAPVLAGALDVPGQVRSARLYASAHGVYVARLNGRRVGDHVLAPGWTAYRERLRYQTYDVTDLVRDGENELEVLLGNGWYRGRLAFTGERARYGDRLALLAQLEVTMADGRVRVLGTDGGWTARESEVLADDLYDGQRTDLRRRGDRHRPASGAVEVLTRSEADPARLVAPEGPPVRVTEVLPARRVFFSPSGRTLVDFGQNTVGWVRLRVRGLAPGTEVTVRHAEVLEDGELGTRPLRTAKVTDSYLVVGGDAEGAEGADEVLEPELTFHGFRYAEVSGVPELRAEDLELVVIGSDLRRTGWFSCSDERLDRFHENVSWSMRGNFVDVPTDCPQRDERLGWTGDIQAFAPTAAFLYDVAGFLGSWLADLSVEQGEDGSVPFVVPDVAPGRADAAAWGDAATLVPWTLYQRTGDLGIVERQLPSMRAWVDRMSALAGQSAPERLWTGGFQFGDWVDPTAPPDEPANARADANVVATAYLARSAQVVADAARLLGREEMAGRYATLAGEVREAFAHAYVTPAGRVLSDSQTVYALALAWALLPGEGQRTLAGERLADLVRTSGFRISTGFVGTPLVTDALTSTGHADVAYRLLLQTGCPSWLYPVTMGATTIWERWDSMLPDGRINPGEMTSFNHYALGGVADWLHRRVAGLAPAAPGYREIRVRPEPTRALSHASATHLTPYGEVSVAWERVDGRFRLSVRVPVGATARVYLPGAEAAEVVGHGRHRREVDDPVAPADAAARSNESAPSWSGPGRSELGTVRDVLDDADAWAAIVAAAVEAGVAPEGEPQLAGRLGRYLDAPADELARVVAPGSSGSAGEFRAAVDAILAAPRS